MTDKDHTKGVPIETGQEASDEVQHPASNTIPQPVSSERLPLARPGPRHAPSVPVPSRISPLRPAKSRRQGGSDSSRCRRLTQIILQYCAQGPTELSGLMGEIAKSTVYRHVGKLVDSGALQRLGRRYAITAVGARWLADEVAKIDWNIFDVHYPPFAHIPTVYHRALLELLVVAVVSRQARWQEDHLCAFIALGGTLRWKTTLARMACATLGVDPNMNLLDLASEAGRSVFVRRTSGGHLLSERNVLSSPLVVFDDYLQASDTVRAAVHPFLTGRRTVPYENGVIAIDCVTLLTVNPRAKPTLEQQTTLDPAQLRRTILCNFDAVPIQDLALTGHRAVEAALQYGPLTLPVMRTDLQAHREAVVRLMCEVVRPDMHDRINSEMLRLLAAGMSGFIDDDARAIQQVFYNFGLMAETVGWARPDWLTAVAQFALHCPRPDPVEFPHPRPTATPETEDRSDIILIRRPIMTTPNSDSDPYTLSEVSRSRFIVMADEEHISFAHAVDIITDFYFSATKCPGFDLQDLHSILAFAKELNVREISVKSVKHTLALLAFLREHQLDFDDYEAAVSLFAHLHQVGLTGQDVEVSGILEVACELVSRGVPPMEVTQWLAQRPNASPQ